MDPAGASWWELLESWSLSLKLDLAFFLLGKSEAWRESMEGERWREQEGRAGVVDGPRRTL